MPPHFLTDVEYDEYDEWPCPVADEIIRQVMRLPIDFRFTEQNVDETIAGIRKVWQHYFEI